MMQLSKILQW